MRSILAFFIVFSSIPAFGQYQCIGLKGGINLTNVINDDIFSHSEFRTGFAGGFTYDYTFESKFTLGLELVYTQKGFTESLIFTDEQGTPTGAEAIYRFNYDYISIPIKGGFSFGDKFEGIINLGVVPSMLFNAEEISPAILTIPESTFNASDRATKFDLGALIEIGGSYKVNDQFSLFMTAAYQHSFISVTNDNYYANWKTRHHGMTVSLGVKYALNRPDKSVVTE